MKFKRFRRDADLEDELRVHLDMQAEENTARGMPPEEARRRARLLLGRTPEVIERVRDQEVIVMLEGWYRDFVFGIRARRQSPVFCVTAILTLAAGIGANTAIFALLYGLLLRDLPVNDPGRLVQIRMVSAASTTNDRGSFHSLPDNPAIRARAELVQRYFAVEVRRDHNARHGRISTGIFS